MPTPLAVVGTSVVKVDAAEKVSGRSRYFDDVPHRDALVGKVLWSRQPHARLVNIERSRALRVPGVKAIVIGADLPDGLMGPFIKDEPILAKGVTRFVGEPLALVAACSDEAAAEALQLIEVEYEELPAVFTAEDALRPGAPLLHPDLASYVKIYEAVQEGNVCSHTTFAEGDLDAGFAEADEVFEDTFTTQRVHQTYLERSGAVVEVDAGGRLVVWSNTQSVHLTQIRIAEALLIPQSKIHVINSRVGGGFGGRMEPTVQPMAAALALKCGKKVKLYLSRDEEFTFGKPRHSSRIDIKTGVKRDGRLTAKQVRLIYNTGAYADDGPGIAGFGAMMARGPYNIPHVRIDAYCVYTNLPKSGAFRGFGNPQATFASESQLDLIAERLRLDPIELRLRNAVQTGDTALGGQRYTSVGLRRCFEQAAARAGWRRVSASSSPTKRRGMGVAAMHHISGLLSAGAFVKINEDGTVGLVAGAVDIGQGCETVLTQIAAEELGVPMSDIHYAAIDSDTAPFNWGTAGSRTTFTVGNAVRLAAGDARRQLLALAAKTLEVSPDDLETVDRTVRVKGSPQRALSYRDLGAISHWVSGGPILAKGSFIVDGPGFDPKRAVLRGFPFGPLTAYIFGVHVVEVEVDVETGEVKVLKAAAAHDVGRAINPTVVEGQIEGGFAQGLGYALFEELCTEGGQTLNPSFIDYKIPSILDVPEEMTAIIVEEEDPHGPFGAKGVGEPGLVATAAAIANAVSHALGVRLRDLPLTPERVLAALEAKQGTLSPPRAP
ncbi:MAG: xanthine dehydrogenase family protein [Candidatus Tectomicrobia bacterium]|nr:xanthine dehydrogenase family protein [Candidatus Tectomicrobia bacterium]